MGTDLPEQTAQAAPADARSVAEYLARHPDFLIARPELAAMLAPPDAHRGKDKAIVDFQQFQVRRLQADLMRQGEARDEIVAHARATLNLATRIHACVLALLECRSFEEMIAAVTTDVAVYLDVDVAAMMIESPQPSTLRIRRSDIRLVTAGQIDSWLGQRRNLLLRGQAEGDPAIYGSAAGLVRSEALLRLEVSKHAPVGMLAFGSRKPDTFQEGQTAELLGFLARVVERCVRMWLDLPE